MVPSIDQIRWKLERADKHIQELTAALLNFKKGEPYKLATKEDPQTRCLVYYITKADDIPVAVPLIAGDALQNIRTSLDHLAWQLVPVYERSPHTAFPIFDDAPKYQAGKTQRIKGMPKAAVDAIDATKPYKGGDDRLWRLHRLNNIDKHRLLITIGAAFQSVNVGPHMLGLMLKAGVGMHLRIKPEDAIRMPDIYLRPKDNLFPLKVGSELFTDMPGATPNPKMNFQIDVAFGEAGVCDGEPVLETLKGMLDLVRNILPDFEPLLR
ncbi:MAG: hypothetical protein ACLP72_02070 [Candidatus Sulfotelmatobacter sp.]